MSGLKILKSIPMGKGTTLNILRDDSQPTTSPDRWLTEAIVTGEGDPFSVPLHWHAKHTETITVREGRIIATVDGAKRILSAGKSVRIPPYTVHGFRGFEGERAVITERAEPAGDYKVAFFNDLLAEGWPAPFWHMMRTFYDGDGYPALGLYFKSFDVAFITVLGGIAKLLLPPKRKLE